MTRLAGARVALLESRLASEITDLVRREGGDPISAPAVFEARLDVTALIPVLIDDIREGRVTVVVLLTGAGINSLFAQAEEIGYAARLTDALSSVTTVCRGPKPAAALRRLDIPVRGAVQPPHTTRELLAALASVTVTGEGTVVLCDGGRAPALVDALTNRGARVQELRSYEWQLPADVGPLEQLIRDLSHDRIDAVAFTTQVQVRHLFAVATRLDKQDELRHALAYRTVVGSIGPTCSAVLGEFGVVPHVTASPPRMRPLITAIGAALAARLHTPGEVGTA